MSKRARSSRRRTPSSRTRATEPRSSVGPTGCAAASTGARSSTSIDSSRWRDRAIEPHRVHGLRRHLARMGRSPARTVLGVVRAVPAVGIVGSDATRHTRRRHRPVAVHRGDGVRRPLPAADPPDRDESSQGPQQRDNDARPGSGQPVGDRWRRWWPHRRASGPRHRRRCRSARRGGADPRPRDRARPGVPDVARPSVGARAPGLVPSPFRRDDRVRREPAEAVRRHLPARLRHGATATASGRRCSTSSDSGSSAGSACSASTIRTRNRSRSGSG